MEIYWLFQTGPFSVSGNGYMGTVSDYLAMPLNALCLIIYVLFCFKLLCFYFSFIFYLWIYPFKKHSVYLIISKVAIIPGTSYI